MSFRNRTHTDRWTHEGAYRTQWAQRSVELFDLFIASEAEEGRAYTVSEYGCGPNAPFAALLADNPAFRVQTYDLKPWDETTKIIDLNAPDLTFDPADIATYSGVLEYLDDIEAVLRASLAAHSYVLLSYAALPLEATQADRPYLNQLNARAVRKGWRNHHTNVDLVRILSSIGVIANVGAWEKHALFVVRSRRI